MFNPKHLAVIRELINHPINEAALRWLEEVERLGLEADLGVRRQPMGPSRRSSCSGFPQVGDREPISKGRLKEEMIRHWDFLEASPKKGLQYLLRF